MRNKKQQYIAVTWKEEKYYVSQCLNVDVSSFGKTEFEALKNLEEAVALYLEGTGNVVPKLESPAIFIRELQYA